MKRIHWRKILAVVMAVAVCATAFDAEAARKKRKRSRRKARTTKVVKKRVVTYDTPVTTGKMEPEAPFVTYEREEPIKHGLEGRNIALWQSHGMYFDQKSDTWKWQRPLLFGTVEDMFTQGFVMPYLMPMLENAGAYVMSPRERDVHLCEIISDTDGTSDCDFWLTEGKYKWTEGEAGTGFAYSPILRGSENPFLMGTSETVQTVKEDDERHQSTANWTGEIPARGRYAIYVSYRSYPNSATDATYIINHLGGSTNVTVNQTMGGGTWIYLGHYDLAKGKPSLPIVTLTNRSDDENAVVSADAVKIGGGMGNVARAGKGDNYPSTSGSPRYTEGSRYWLQWAGMPQKVYTESNGTNDYTDDYKSRALWVNYLAGGSAMLPDSAGLGIPIDMAFAFHSDAGMRDDGSVVGTLGIYSTDDGVRLGNNRSRNECGELTNMVVSQIVDDVRALYRSDWSDRGTRDRKYYEIRETKVPAMILELLSHQNFEDMKYGLNPEFRFDVARAVYKGILKFVNKRYGEKAVVQPLPVNSFAITAGGNDHYRLTWHPTIDHLELSAQAKYYIVEERVENGAFIPVATVKEPKYDVEVPADGKIRSYRIVAGNDGGTSFPSEVLSLYNAGTGHNDVLIVNGFTRVSAPDAYTTGFFDGLDYRSDGGVPDGLDIITAERRYDYSSDSELHDGEEPGAESANPTIARTVTAGNTRDFVYLHGRSLRAAGLGFTSSSMEAFSNRSHTPQVGAPGNPPVVDLILGKQKEIMPADSLKGTKFKAFTPQLQRQLEEYCKSGGSLMVSGSYIARDLMDNRFSDQTTRMEDAFFAGSWLGFSWVPTQDSSDGKVEMGSTEFPSFSRKEISFRIRSNADSYGAEFTDAIEPMGGRADAIMRYTSSGQPAAVASEKITGNASGSTYRVVAIGFPFETIASEKTRHEVMKDIMTFLRKK